MSTHECFVMFHVFVPVGDGRPGCDYCTQTLTVLAREVNENKDRASTVCMLVDCVLYWCLAVSNNVWELWVQCVSGGVF